MASAVSTSGSTVEASVEATLVSTLTTSAGDDDSVIGVVGTSALKNVGNAPRSCDGVGWVLGVRPKVYAASMSPRSDEVFISCPACRSVIALWNPCGRPWARAVTTSAGLTWVGKSPKGVGTFGGPGDQPWVVLP